MEDDGLTPQQRQSMSNADYYAYTHYRKKNSPSGKKISSGKVGMIIAIVAGLILLEMIIVLVVCG